MIGKDDAVDMEIPFVEEDEAEVGVCDDGVVVSSVTSFPGVELDSVPVLVSAVLSGVDTLVVEDSLDGCIPVVVISPAVLGINELSVAPEVIPLEVIGTVFSFVLTAVCDVVVGDEVDTFPPAIVFSEGTEVDVTPALLEWVVESVMVELEEATFEPGVAEPSVVEPLIEIVALGEELSSVVMVL